MDDGDKAKMGSCSEEVLNSDMNSREVARTLGKRIVLTCASLADFRMTKQKGN